MQLCKTRLNEHKEGKLPALPHFEYVIFIQSEVSCSELDAFAWLCLDGVNALMVVAIVTRVVGREKHPLHASHG